MNTATEDLNDRITDCRKRLSFIKRTRSDIMRCIHNDDSETDLETAKNDLIKVIDDEDEVSTEISELTAQLSLQHDSAASARDSQHRDREDPKDTFHDSLSDPPEVPLPVKPTQSRRHSDVSSSQNANISYKAIAKPNSFRSGDDITLFFERFKNFVLLSNANHGDLSLLLLNYVQDDKMYRTLKVVKLTPTQKSNIDELVAAYESHLFPATETRILRSTLSSIKQKASESIKDFAMRIDEISSKAFTNTELKEEGSLQAFLSGLRSLQIRQKLMESDVNTFDHATRLAVKLDRISEALTDQTSEADNSDHEFNVLRLNTRNDCQLPPSLPPGPSRRRPFSYPSAPNLNQRYNAPRNQAHTHPNVTCFFCQGKGHKIFECPARPTPPTDNSRIMQQQSRNSLSHITCFSCNIKGHYASSCPTRSVPRSTQQNSSAALSADNQQGPSNDSSNWRSQQQNQHTGTDANLNENSAGFPVHPSRL